MVRIAEEEGIKCISKKMTIQEIIKYLEKDIPVIIALQARNEDKNINRKETRDD